jgi:hypothetical protein
VFNALRTDELLLGIGRVLRRAAKAEPRLEGFDRSLVLSATSVSRLLASEQRAQPALLATTRRAIDEQLDGDDRPLVVDVRRRIDAAVDGTQVGDAVADLLAELPRPDPLRDGLQRVLRAMADAEVAALAARPEGAR